MLEARVKGLEESLRRAEGERDVQGANVRSSCLGPIPSNPPLNPGLYS